ncbi:MAG: Glu-tRNA(Gln) amidotransferase subunit GatE [Thermoplasmatota archaeon]
MISKEEAKELAVQGDLDYEALGFMCGLEIHQQLDTRKLFSPCPSGVVDPDAVRALSIAQYDRRLRATQSELGQTDPAVVAEAKKRKSFRYLAIDGLTSLVELDEEPPHPMSLEALDVTLQFAGLTGARPANEVHVMRKTVIDGSNTSGFQRTSLVATGGSLDVEGGDVGIWTIAVEEDSARKVDEKDGWVTYSLDRLGVPLIEVATAPQIKHPKHAQATAARIGGLLRATGKVRRGLGSIRQDLNVSIGAGERVEIKGCQDLRAVPRVIEAECRRQLWLHFVSLELQDRGFTQPGSIVDVSEAFADCTSKMVVSTLKKGKMLALPLPKWAGLIAGVAKDAPRLGKEFADYAKQAAGVKGVFHSDELPAYGIGQTETDAVRAQLGLADEDGFVLCMEKESVARTALEAVAERAVLALEGTLKEVRAAQPDESTRYMRPLPGAARMYPETDVPPIRITADHWAEVLENLPMRPEERIAMLAETGIHEDLAMQMVREGTDAQYESLLAEEVEPVLAARVMTQLAADLQESTIAQVPAVADALRNGLFAKEAFEEVLAALDKGAASVEAAVKAAGAEAADESLVDEVINRVVAEREDFVKERGMAAMGPLMGPVMAELRGKADGGVISAKLTAAIQALL